MGEPLDFLSESLRQHRRIVPGETQFRIRNHPAQRRDHFVLAGFDEDKHVPLGAFAERHDSETVGLSLRQTVHYFAFRVSPAVGA